MRTVALSPCGRMQPNDLALLLPGLPPPQIGSKDSPRRRRRSRPASSKRWLGSLAEPLLLVALEPRWSIQCDR